MNREEVYAMKQKRRARLFAVVGLFSLGAVATVLAQPAPEASTPPSASPGKSTQTNKGGRLHGLERADQAAGRHGQQGRETAREAQLNRPDHSDRSGPSERPVKPDRSGR